MKVSGPYHHYSSPFGKAMMGRNEWFAYDGRGSICIVRFDAKPRRYIIDGMYPQVVFPSLKKALAWCGKMLKNPKHRDWKKLCS